MLFTMLVLVGVSGALAGPWLEMAQSQNIQADMELNLPVEDPFSAFKRVHNKQYEDAEEETMRQKIFAVNIDYINQHNKKYQRREKSFYLGVNQFTDLTHKEFMALYTGHLGKKPVRSNATTYISPAYVVLPDSVDWRTKGYVTPVKDQDQGQCLSSWAFSAIGSVEGQHMWKTGKLVSLSEQQLVDCVYNTHGTLGCNGGSMTDAYNYIQACGGVESETDYPYRAKHMKCTYDKSLEKAKVIGYVEAPFEGEDVLQNIVATVGPASIAIGASQPSFQFYAGGVYDEPSCSTNPFTHALLAAGYGVDAGKDYWLVKNSWGKTWGEEGYIRMSRNKDNQCGVASWVTFPLV